MKVSILNPLSAHCTARIGLEGEFDALGCKEIRKDFEELVGNYIGQYIELDLSAVSFIDSSGIGAIVFLYKRMLENNGQLKLVEVTGQPKELISLLRVDKAITVEWAVQRADNSMEV